MITFDEDFVLLDMAEAAAELKVSRNRIQSYIRADVLAAVYHGGRWMISLDEVERFRREHRPAPTHSEIQRARRFRPEPTRTG